MGLRISEGVNADYAESIPKRQSQELIRRSRRTRETKKDGLVLFKIEDREILACTLILLHLTKSSCESTMRSHIFPDCFGLKNGLSLAMRPYALIFYCFGGTKRATPLFCWTLPLLVFDDFPNLTTASPTLTSEFFALLLAFKNASDNRSHRNEQEREHRLIWTSKKSIRFPKGLKISPRIHSYL